MDSYYITTSIPYPSGEPHVGHSFEMIAADTMARYRRLTGEDVLLLGGLDENSQRVSRAAREVGTDPQMFADRISRRYIDAWDSVDVVFDDFVRTTEQRHHEAVYAFYERVFQKGDIYEGRYEGWYCYRCEEFLSDEELVDKCCPVHHTSPEWVEEDNYFFALSKYEGRLLELYEECPDFVWPETRRNEMLGFLRQGLSDFSISRAGASWGIRLPTNPDHAIYVWFDALINYLTGVGFGQGSESQAFASRWPANVHVIGKDIVRFHAIYWPAMLMSAGLELPRQIAVHGWVSFAGEELTQSGGHVVTPAQVIERYGSDVLRYFLLREVAFDRDGDFSWEAIARRYRDDLGNDLGNLVLRSISMLKRYEDGVVPEIGKVTEIETSLLALQQTAWEVTATNFENWRFHQALSAIWKYINGVNRYIEQTEPWKLAREDSERQRLRTVLATVLDALPKISTMIRPVMPQTADNIDAQLGISGNPAPWGASSGVFSAGHKVPGGAALFPRLDG